MSKLSITVDGFTFEVEVALLPNGDRTATVMVDGAPVKLVSPDLNAAPGEMEWFIVDDRPYEVMIDPDLEWMRSAWGIHSLEIEDLEIVTKRPATGDGRVKAPIPGVVTQVMAAPGDRVERGQPLLVLEAMKMQNELRAPRDGQVKALNVSPGQRVSLGEVVVEVE
jgi:biotin carboxyl carrier protein